MDKASKAEDAQPKMIGATLFLERQQPIDYAAMAARIGPAIGLNPANLDGQGPTSPMVLPVDGDVVFGLPMDFPYPDPLQQQAQFAFWWPTALADLSRHTSHLMIHCSWRSHTRLEAHMRHLILMRELVEQLPVIGVLWGSSLVQTETFKGESASAMRGAIPFSLWVLIQFSMQPNGNILISTIGMRDFGHMEIETESSLTLDQTFDRVRKFGSYILAKGAVIKDGETFGLTDSERIKVRYTRSFRPDVNTVYWLELTKQPSIHKPSGFFSKLFGSKTRQ
ncbi:hypothetical protein SSBR45G_33400 [Bradyrhizobium sp. SSBR45G]|uniref:DUF4261 domain-containing protein n=1 Tax=unclassified Bradyrhizobium TaxID=2631580 RepID=UPI002342AC61|nr:MULTISPECIES: DUF4261 domain-containing protein [unclassified Bradyrhizobium]GLH78431.1 hypothetical protein SSBR45G_33400 [Bradyrhizobium sp. SSBR45G]GLH86214.1 hypothetical protein SSBR45R_36740 [Bradyrhizobium sp. SSBR45R]